MSRAALALALSAPLHTNNGVNHHRGSTVTGVCRETTDGPLTTGSVTLTVEVGPLSGNHGDCYTGWNEIGGHFLVRELP